MIWKKSPSFSFAHTKWKTEYFLEKFFSKFKVWKFSAQSREMKNIFSGKRWQIVLLHNYFAALRKVPSFLPNLRQIILRFQEKKIRVTRKNKNVLFHNLMALLKTLMKIFLPKLGYLRPQSIKSLFLWKKRTKKSTGYEKWKTEKLLGEKLLKIWKFSAQKREMKKHFLWKKYQNVLLRTYLAVLRKQPELFCPNFDKKCSRSRENFEESRKNKYAVFPILNALSKTLLKTFLLEPDYLSKQSKNGLNLRENNQSVRCTRKMKNCDFCRRSFDHSLEVFRSKYLIKGTFHLKKNFPVFLSHTQNEKLSTFWRSFSQSLEVFRSK